MSLRDAVFCGRIAGRAFHGAKRSLTSHTAFKLTLDFLRRALLERVGATIQRDACDHEEDRHAIHPHIL